MEDTTKCFVTHNYCQDIKIAIDEDTIFNQTIKKVDFDKFLFPELKKYAVLMYPTFEYQKKENKMRFGYSISIPITDVGVGLSLIIDNKGNIIKTDK